MTTKEFEREERYIVVKLKRIDDEERDALTEFLQSWQIPTEECVVVESDWPNYEHTWTTVEQVASGIYDQGAWIWYQTVPGQDSLSAKFGMVAPWPEQRGDDAQVMGRVHHESDQEEATAVLNSIGRKLPDGAPMYSYQFPLSMPNGWNIEDHEGVILLNAPDGNGSMFSPSESQERILLVRQFLQVLMRGNQPEPKIGDFELPGDIGSFYQLIMDAREEAEKAMAKFPQPNYVLTKVAEEAGEVVKEGVHCAEGRGSYENLRAEMKQTIAMLYRLWVEGDEVHGVLPVSSAQEQPDE